MRILYLHPKAWSGEYPVLATLRGRGHDVFVLEEWRGDAKAKGGRKRPAMFATPEFLRPGDGIETLWYDPHRGVGKLLTWPVDRFFKRAFSGRNLAHRMLVIRAAMARFQPDVVVCTDGFTYALPAAYLKRLGLLPARLLVSYIGGDILDCPEADYGRRRTTMVDAMFRAAIPAIDVFRPVSPLLAMVLVRDGAAPDKVKVVPSHLPKNLARLREIHDRRGEIRREIEHSYQLSPTSPLLITLSYNFRGKGVHLLAQQWHEILRKFPQAKWLLCGPESPWIIQEVIPILTENGCRDSVIFTGPLKGDAVFEYLAAADLHISPTLCEGLNMVTVEAAAVGTPTISGDMAGIADWITRFGAGAVVPSGNAGALGEAIIGALSSPSQIALWDEASLRMAQDFSLERIAIALESMIEGEIA